jgi:TldD protein
MNIDLLLEGLEKSENVGADFLEIRYDDLQLRTLLKENESWKEIQSKRRRGIGVASYVKGVMGYSSTAILTVDAIRQAAIKATKIATVTAEISSINLSFSQEEAIIDKVKPPFQIKKHPRTIDLNEKIDLIERGMDIGKESAGDQVSMVKGMYGEMYGKKLFVNSEGSQIDWDFLITDLRFQVVAKGVDGLVTGSDGFGGSHGLEKISNGHSPETLAKNAGIWAKEQLNAKPSPAGHFRCLAEQRLVGVLAHESFGHLSEADFIVSRGSPLTDRLGESIANEVVSIFDIGEPDISKYGGLWLPYDDQGSKTLNTQIVDKGILKGYLNTRGTASYFEDVRTGNARSINFSFHPIPRMKNTYIAPGDYSHEEAIEELKTGIYAIRTSGGQVDGNGEFLFKAMRGYYVENGEIKYPIKEVSLSGNILDLLKEIEGCGNTFELSSGYFGGCGKSGQYPLPVGLGGPEILFSKVRFGGESSKRKGSDLQMEL